MQIQTNPVAANLAASAVNDQVARKISDGTSQVATKPVAATPPSEPASNDQVKAAVNKVNDVVKSLGRGLEFSVDDETNIQVVKVVDTQSKEVIRQIPSEEVINISKALDNLQGLLVRDKA